MKNSNNYTNAQKSAIMHREGPAAVFAGPGSGKTFVLIEHIFYLIDTLHIKPQNILVITFTKAAAVQMEERFFQKVNRRLPIVFKTFHAFFYQVLSQSISHANKKILTVKEKKYIYKLIAIEVFPLLCNSTDLFEQISICISKRKEYREISKKENDFSEAEENKIIQIYEEEKEKLGKIDFIDLVFLCFGVLKREPELLNKTRMQFPYILIDEFQDITPIQYEIMVLLANHSKSIFIVGDEDQSIYRFCGSRPDCMQQFIEDFPQVVQYLLEENFRSSKKIIQSAHRLINQNTGRFDKKVIAQSKNEGEFEVVAFKTKDEEIQYMIKKIYAWGEEEKNKGENESIKTIAIILRTKSSMNQVQLQFIKNRIRIVIKNKEMSFFENQRVKDIYAYLNFVKNGYMREDLLQILYKPMRYIRTNVFRKEKVNFEEVLSYVEEYEPIKDSINKMKIQMNLMKIMSISGAIHFIRTGIGYDSYLKELAIEKTNHIVSGLGNLIC
jgi:DNA helicase-2/ATP-dependent DNA helicase PcrA